MRLGSRQRDRGQAAVEFAVALPVVVFVVLVIGQLLLVAHAQLKVGLVAREAARAAAVAQPGTPPPTVDGVTVSVAESANAVTATATIESLPTVPLIGPFVRTLTISSTVTMAIEPP